MKGTLRETLDWIARSEGDPFCERKISLLRVLGIVSSAHCLSEWFNVGENPSAERCRRIHEPLPDRLAVSVYNIVRARYAVDSSKTNGSPVYSLPWWLACKPSHFHRNRPSFQVMIGKSRRLTVRHAVTGDELEAEQLNHVKLRHLSLSRKRRKYLSGSAAKLFHELGEIIGPSDLALDWGWLELLRDNPISVEVDALEVWRRFIADCDLPSSFRIPGRMLSLADLMTLRAGSEGGRHRHSFAEQQPWAARILLRESCAKRTFAKIDQNPANAIEVSAQYLCCNPEANESSCPKAAGFARSIARHRNNPSIDRLLGTNNQEDRRIRSLLMEAHKHDKELLTHIGTNVRDTRRLIKHAIRLIFDYRDMGGGIGCAYELATLLVRMMVRNQMDSGNFDREILLRGLVAMSADCLAAFASDRLSNPSVVSPEPDADSIDLGLLAFVAFIGGTKKPQLTSRQLHRFARAANGRGVHNISVIKDHPDARWSFPGCWPNVDFSDPQGEKKIVPLTSAEDILEEGRRMNNCLAGGRYIRAAIVGRLAFFSISGNSDRATLSVKHLECTGPDGEILIDKWEIDQLCGVGNSEPSETCKDAAELVIQRLNERCPNSIPSSEIARRNQILTDMDKSRGANLDIVSAQRNWDEIYLDLLPPRFENLSPSEIVDNYLATG